MYKILLLCLVHMTFLSANDKVVYNSQDEKTTENALGYSKMNQSVSRYLAYRDIPSLLAKYVNGNKALDYGAGTGFSSLFLLDQNLDVVGVDVSTEMLIQAAINCQDVPFHLIVNEKIPAASNTYDLIFSSLVLFELESEEKMVDYLEEAKRVMADDGVMIAVTGSQDAYSNDWFIFDNDYQENKNLKSGDLVKIYLRDAGIEFTDFYWTEADYRQFFKKSGLDLVEIHYPLGKDNEGYAWKDEKTVSPFVILVAKKF